ncbi:MAG TPA: sulfatase [Firmicutes bacterium]|nr:sulfatase [Bacillota bacterium]
MNIIYIHTHDVGRFIEPYGHNVRTPNLFKLAKEGTLFRQAFCTAPTCSPSRASMLTGEYPHSIGMLGLTHRGFKINDHSKHLAHYLRANGIETVLCGFQHESSDLDQLGYSRYLGNDSDLNNAKKVVQFLENREPNKSFFLSFGMMSAHRPFPQLEEDDVNPNYVCPPFGIHDNPETRKDMARFIKGVHRVDECVGMVMEAVKNSGLEENTLIFFTTDHGIAFPGMKCTLYDVGIGVSLIIKYPANPSRGEVVDSLVSHIDIYPTVCDFLGVEKPPWVKGNSLLPLMEKKVESVQEEIYAEINFHAAYEPMRCIRTERYKYIKFFDDHNDIVAVNIDDGLTKNFLVENGLLEHKRESEYLFDLYLDPLEKRNLVNHSSYQDVYQTLAVKLQVWMEKTDDPLLDGAIPKPKGTRIHDRTCLSTREKRFL